MKFQYIIVFFLIGFYLKSHAELKLKISRWNDAAELAQMFPKLLIDNGIDRIGNLNLKELVQKINDKNELSFISVYDLNNNIFLGGNWVNPENKKDRIGAECYTFEETNKHFYDPVKQIGSKRFVNINHHSPLYQNLEPYYLQFTLLHESLCSLYGFSVDDQYQITSSIVFILGLLNKPDELNKYLLENKWNFLDPFINTKLVVKHESFKISNPVKRHPANGGGVTVGPGGGDPWSAYFKFILMNTLHGKEIECNKQNYSNDNESDFSNVSCKIFLEQMSNYWDKLRQLNIETEMPHFMVEFLNQFLQLNPYWLNINSDSSVSLVINRAILNKIEMDYKNKFSLEKAKYHMSFLTKAFYELIIKWSNENDKDK